MDYGVIVDVETTGLNPDRDGIIEIGVLGFELEADRAPVITQMYSAVADPGFELPAEITRLTGLTDHFLKNKKIDWQIVRSLIERASIAIAHNADFDRSFLAKQPEIKDLIANLHWACSKDHISWGKLGYSSRKLTYLAADHGFVNPFPHRALFDCATTFRLVAPHLNEMLARSYEREVKLSAVGSPFEARTVLKSREYQWNPEEKTWFKIVSESEAAEERAFLKDQVYRGRSNFLEEVLAK